MKLSNSNELLKFYTIDEIPDKHGGVEKQHSEALTLFGRVYLVQVDHKNCHHYKVEIPSNNELTQYSNKKLMISTKGRNYIVYDIKINKKSTTIKCYDYKYSTNDI